MSIQSTQTGLDFKFKDDTGKQWTGVIICQLEHEPRGRGNIPVDIDRDYVEDEEGNLIKWEEMPLELQKFIDAEVEEESDRLFHNRRT